MIKNLLCATTVMACLVAQAQTFTTIGNTTFSSNGTSYQQIGNTTFGSNGTTSQQIGNTTFINGPSGQTRTCQQIGAQTFCN